MNEFGRVLEHVINAFDDISLAQHDFVPKRHQLVLHIGLYSCYYMDSILEKSLEKPWRDISPVGKEPSVQFLCQYIPYFRIPVVHISSCEAEGYDFPTVIAGEMQLEAVTPAHCPFPICSHALENLVGIPPQVVADRNHCAVHKADAGTSAESVKPKEKHQFEEHTAFQFHEPVVRYRIGKFTAQVYLDIVKVIMLEVGKCPEMEHYQDGHDFTIGKRRFTVPTTDTGRGYKFAFGYFRIKFLTKFIQSTENIRNFVLGNHMALFH